MKPIDKTLIDKRQSRRQAVILIAAAPLLATRLFSFAANAETLPEVTVHRDPNCGCCGGWVEHLQRSGFPAKVVATDAIDTVKQRLGVPDDLASCHTAEVAGYAVEGHVPASAIRRLLAEKPQAIGLAVPGMPSGSPGMEGGGTPDTYDVVLFGPQGRRTFARFTGDREI